MMDANYISERLDGMRQEISDLRVTTARYWSKDQHTTLEKSAFALESLTKPWPHQTPVAYLTCLLLGLGFASGWGFRICPKCPRRP
jgi:hypothetical protein